MIIVLSELDIPVPDGVVAVQDLDHLTTELAQARDQRTLILSDEGNLTHLAQMARAAVHHPDCVVVALGGLLTARVHLYLGLATLDAPDYGFAEEVRDLLAQDLRTQFALTSVARLTEPAPGLGNHLRSWWPPTRFHVDVDDGIITHDKTITWSLETGRHSVLAIHDPQENLRLEDADLHEVHQLEVPVRPTWASAAWAELTQGPSEPAAAVRALLSQVEGYECPWCTHRGVGASCPACGVLHLVREDSAPLDPESLETIAGVTS